jgi:hypothetical protein
MSAPITEAHRKLRETLEIRWMRATELEIEQLVAESEAAAVQTAMIREYGNLCATNESLAKERDQLRAEMERLGRATTNGQVNWMQESERQQARAERAEAELASERARLDWLGQLDNESRKWYLIMDAVNIRAAIDAAMKESAK